MRNLSSIIGSMSNNSIIAVKGLPASLLPNEIKAKWFDADLWENDTIDLQKLYTKEFKRKIIALTDTLETPVFISYEALVAAFPILKEFGYEATLRVVNMQFVSHVANNFSNTLIETNEECMEECTIWESILSDIISIDDAFYIQYKDGELLANAEVVDCFASNEIAFNDLETVIDSKLNNAHTLVQFENNDYIARVYQWLHTHPTNVNLVIDQGVLKNEVSKRTFGKILSVLETFQIDYKVQRLVHDVSKSSKPEINELLKKYWGENAAFKSLEIYADPDISKEKMQISQADIIETIIDEYEKGVQPSQLSSDVFFTASTGAGKSLMFQIPAMYLAKKYNTLSIIVTPLKALMEDQVFNLKNRSNYHRVAFINADVNYLEREVTLELIEKGEIDLLYLAPESLLSYDIKDFLRGRSLGLYIVDEAHTVTTWGRDFRADYWYLGTHIQKLRSQSKYNIHRDMNFVVVGATATAPYNGTHDVVFETISSLHMRNARKFIGNVRRNDIIFDIQSQEDEVKGNLSTYKQETTLRRVEEFEANQDKTIVYCPYSSQVSNLIKSKGSLSMTGYFGTMDVQRKKESLNYFKEKKVATMVATKAFGMGIDISDITRVYHYAPTGLLTDYIQEVGRAARKPGTVGIASVDYTKRDFQFVNVLHGLSKTHDWQLVEVMKRIYKNYETTKKANQLINVEDFVHIFGSADSINNDMKNALLLIEKDLQMKSEQTPILIARPKNLFATVYAAMSVQDFEVMEKEFGKECVKKAQQNKSFEDRVFVTLELDKIWEQKYQKQSFAFIKSLFYKKDLFKNVEVKPVLKMQLSINESLPETLERMKQLFAKIQLAFARLSGFFTAEDFIKKLIEVGVEPQRAKAMGATLLTIFSKSDGRGNVPAKEMINDFSFVQKRRTETDFEYRLVSQAMSKVFSLIRSTVARLFEKNEAVEKFVCIKGSVHQTYTLVGQFLDSLELGTCSTIGGENAKIFVRVNDPFRLKSIMNNDYENGLTADIRHRHKEGVEVMKQFFETPMDNQQRWDFIEDYFLGKI